MWGVREGGVEVSVRCMQKTWDLYAGLHRAFDGSENEVMNSEIDSSVLDVLGGV